jgi:hypothetical protein
VRLSAKRSGEIGLEKFAYEIDKAGIPHPIAAKHPAPQTTRDVVE